MIIFNSLDKLSACSNGTQITGINATISPSDAGNVDSCFDSINYSRFLSDFDVHFRPQVDQEVSALRLKLARRFYKRFIYDADLQYYRNRMLKTASNLAFQGELEMRNQTILEYMNSTCRLCSNLINGTASNLTARSCVDESAIESPLMHKLGDRLQDAMSSIRFTIDRTIQEYMKTFSAYILINSTNEFPELMFNNRTMALLRETIVNTTNLAYKECCHKEQVKALQPQNIIH